MYKILPNATNNMVNSLLELTWTIKPAIYWKEDHIDWSPKTAEILDLLNTSILFMNTMQSLSTKTNYIEEFVLSRSVYYTVLMLISQYSWMMSLPSQVSTWLLI